MSIQLRIFEIFKMFCTKLHQISIIHIYIKLKIVYYVLHIVSFIENFMKYLFYEFDFDLFFHYS